MGIISHENVQREGKEGCPEEGVNENDYGSVEEVDKTPCHTESSYPCHTESPSTCHTESSYPFHTESPSPFHPLLACLWESMGTKSLVTSLSPCNQDSPSETDSDSL